MLSQLLLPNSLDTSTLRVDCLSTKKIIRKKDFHIALARNELDCLSSKIDFFCSFQPCNEKIHSAIARIFWAISLTRFKLDTEPSIEFFFCLPSVEFFFFLPSAEFLVKSRESCSMLHARQSKECVLCIGIFSGWAGSKTTISIIVARAFEGEHDKHCFRCFF